MTAEPGNSRRSEGERISNLEGRIEHLATRADLEAVKSELKSDIAALKTDITHLATRSDISNLKTDIVSDISNLKTDIAKERAGQTRWTAILAIGIPSLVIAGLKFLDLAS